MSDKSPSDWGYRNCSDCRLVREAMRHVAQAEAKEKSMALDLTIALLDVVRLREDLLQYTRGITDFKELADDQNN